MRIKFEVIDDYKDTVTPRKSYKSDAGWDLYALDEVILPPSQVVFIPVGIRLVMPIDADVFALNATPSGLAKRGLTVLGGIIDPGYAGDCGPLLLNTTAHPQKISSHMKVSQLVFLSRVEVVVDNDLVSKFVRKPKVWSVRDARDVPSL